MDAFPPPQTCGCGLEKILRPLTHQGGKNEIIVSLTTLRLSLSPPPSRSTTAEGLIYVLSFLWKPPILIAWKPRADLDRAAMDPARETVVSSIYKVTRRIEPLPPLLETWPVCLPVRARSPCTSAAAAAALSLSL